MSKLLISKPTLLLNEVICRANIKRMAEKCRSLGIEFRPHFKTHQSYEIGRWFRAEGVRGITVSSLGMAAYFAKDGWTDITVAFPCNIRQIDQINELAAKIDLRVLIDNEQTLDFLTEHLASNIEVYIEVDCGGNRSGVKAEDIDQIEKLAESISASDKMRFVGIYSHAGHTYEAQGKESILGLSGESLKKIYSVFEKIKSKYNSIGLCYGDTPSCSVRFEFGSVTSLSPGNFVFYDVMQSEIGSCVDEDIAVTVACPIIGMKKERSEVLIYGGAVQMSKDHDPKYGFGRVVTFTDQGWKLLEGAKVSRLSQEHGVISMPENQLDKFKVGDAIGILPIHSCLTAECLGEYTTLDGKSVDHYKQKKHA